MTTLRTVRRKLEVTMVTMGKWPEHQRPEQRYIFVKKRRLVLYDSVFPEWVSEIFLFAVAILRTDIPMPGRTTHMTMGAAMTRTETTTTMTMTTSALIPPPY
jgi:hypothetical protein